MRWYRSLRWRLTLAFVGLLAALLAIAGAVEYTVLHQAVLSSRAQSLQSTYGAARAIVSAEQRQRRRSGAKPLGAQGAALALARLLAQARVTAGVFSGQLALLASAGPGSGAGSGVVAGVAVPPLAQEQLAAAAQFDTRVGPVLVGPASHSSLVMLFPLETRFGHRLGAVELAQPAGPIQGELDAAAAVLGLGGLAVLLLALLTGLALTSRGLGPLSRLTAAARALGRGELSRRSGLAPRQDEVGVLARVFDEMAASVEHTVHDREQGESRMRQFIADASHELRTPLTAIKGYIDVLERGAKADPAALDQALPVMAREAERMRSLILDLLALARADARRPPQPQPLELASFLSHFLEGREVQAEVERDFRPGLVAWADPEALATIAGNLQDNAQRHGQGRGVRWSTLDQEGMVGFSCSDRGPGIAPDDLEHVFERFYRSGRSRSREEGGSGLGLAIVQSLVQAQGGRVAVDSQPGGETTFTVLVPRAPESPGPLTWARRSDPE